LHFIYGYFTGCSFQVFLTALKFTPNRKLTDPYGGAYPTNRNQNGWRTIPGAPVALHSFFCSSEKKPPSQLRSLSKIFQKGDSMAPASTTLHEPADQLTNETINIHRALVSLMEELEAIDWYHQRAEACTDSQLQAILTHNMNEEIEHASMALEWIRRNFPKFDEALKTYLFTTGDITQLEKAVTGGKEQAAKTNRPGLRTTVGNMKGSSHD